MQHAKAEAKAAYLEGAQLAKCRDEAKETASRDSDSSSDAKSNQDDASENSDKSDDGDDKADKPRPRSRRKPYAKREKADDAPEAETDGVLKTVSRGRRKAAPKGDDGAQPEEASAETTD